MAGSASPFNEIYSQHNGDAPQIQITRSNYSAINLSCLQISARNIDPNQTAGAGCVNRHAVALYSAQTLVLLDKEDIDYLGPLMFKKWLILLLRMARPTPIVTEGARSSGSRACMSA